MPFPTVSHAGNLIVNPSGTNPGEIETPLRWHAWWLTDLSPLWGFPALRGENVILPGFAGRHANPRRNDEGVYVMPLSVFGDVGATGGVNANVLAGLETNLDYLYTNVGQGSSVTRLAKLVKPSGVVIDGVEVQIRLSLVASKGLQAGVMVEVTVPAGRFA